MSLRSAVPRVHASPREVVDAHGCVALRCRVDEGWNTPLGLRTAPDPTQNARLNHHHEPKFPDETGRRWVAKWLGRSRRQTSATLGSARLQHGSTTLGLHPLTEPVFLCTPTLAGLKCSFHASLLTSLSRRLEATPPRLGGRCGSPQRPTAWHRDGDETDKHIRCDSSFGRLWKTCYVPSPRTAMTEHTTSYTTGILHMMWVLLWMKATNKEGPPWRRIHR